MNPDPTRSPSLAKANLADRYAAVRGETDRITAVLSDEDQVLQSMPSCSPAKWHRAHTTWFFETFILAPRGHKPFDREFGYLFNSYYEAVGHRIARNQRGMLSRPSCAEVQEYRTAIDQAMLTLIRSGDAPLELVLLGLNHEQQHQELILTDILHAFSQNPLGPVYASEPITTPSAQAELAWSEFAGGLLSFGISNSDEFHFDNESPRHQHFLRPFRIANRPITVGEVQAFIAERGYSTPALWLSEGYATAIANGWTAPLYWGQDNGQQPRAFSLRGWRILDAEEPASHLSYWEADAIARFLGARLPTEFEWECAAQQALTTRANFLPSALIPVPATTGQLGQLFGDVWEWTSSSYAPYPGFRPAAGAVGEYNGKFMAQQYVLRGGSCLTPPGHVRATYRNFWHPDTRFQMSGARLADDI